MEKKEKIPSLSLLLKSVCGKEKLGGKLFYKFTIFSYNVNFPVLSEKVKNALFIGGFYENRGKPLFCRLGKVKPENRCKSRFSTSFSTGC